MAKSPSKAKLDNTPANQIDAQAPMQESNVFDQPMPMPEASAEGSNVLRLSPAPSNTYATREEWLNAGNVKAVKFLDENGVKAATDAMISISHPMAKRLKNGADAFLLKGKFAQTYPPSQSTNGKFQIFISSQLDGDRDLLLALVGQLIRTSVWSDKDSKDGLSKSAKELISKFGLVYETETGKIACYGDSPLLAFVASTIHDLGPSPYARIDIKANDLPQRTATRSAKVYCDDKDCACQTTDTAKNGRKNEAGGYSYQSSDNWITEILIAKNPDKTLAEIEALIPFVDVTNKKDVTQRHFNPNEVSFITCPFGTSTLKYTESEFRREKRLEKETGKTSEMK